MVNRIILVVIIAGISVWIGYEKLEENKRREIVRIENERRDGVVRHQVDLMREKYSANGKWESDLSKGETYRLEHILSIELERDWIENGPILFVGTIKDIKSNGADKYELVIERDLLSSIDYMFNTELKLSLAANKSSIDNFMASHQDIFTDNGLNNCVAVVAQIDKIIASDGKDEEGGTLDIKIGSGKLVDIVFLGQTRLQNSK